MTSSMPEDRRASALKLCLRLGLYFASIAAALYLVRGIAPDVFEVLPFGGLDVVEDRALQEPRLVGSERDVLEVISTAVASDFGRLD